MRLAGWLSGFVALLLAAAGVAQRPEPRAESPKADCAFSNTYYSGWCRVTIPLPPDQTPQQACAVVLSCLNGNNAVCQGNIHPCHSPDLRSGWKLEESGPSRPLPTPTR